MTHAESWWLGSQWVWQWESMMCAQDMCHSVSRQVLTTVLVQRGADS
jgi:hypothetical protein